jgi:Sulfotransferase family
MTVAERFSPVFIVGCQRSGSTMLGAMLGAHPDMVCLPEAQFIRDFLPADPADCIDPDKLLRAIEEHWRFKIWDFNLAGARPRVGAVAPSFAAIIAWLSQRYAAFVGKPAARIWIEQQPGHLKCAWHLAQHFADARFLHIVRDGRAVALSLMERDWGPKRILAAAKFWQERVAIGLALESSLGSARVQRVQYEALLTQPSKQLARLADFLGVPDHPAMQAPTGLRLPAFTRVDHTLIGARLARSRGDRWQQHLNRRDIEIFEGQTGDLLPLLGYDLVCGPHPRALGGFEKLRLTIQDHGRRLIGQFRFAQRRRRHLKGPQVSPRLTGNAEQLV